MRIVQAPFLSLLALGAPLLGQEARFGLQAGLAVPVGDTRTVTGGKAGYALGLNLPIDFRAGTLRPRLNVVGYDGTQDYPGGYQRSANRMTTVTLAVDWLSYYSGRGHGLYSIAGIGVATTSRDSTHDSFYDASSGLTSSRTKVGGAVNLGLGWQFNRSVALEVQGSVNTAGSSTFRSSTFKSSLDIDANLGIGVAVRF